MAELKPCPFCGGKAVMQSFSTQREKCIRYRVICDKCGVENGWEHFKSEEAAEAWNRRAGEDGKVY